MFINKNRTKVQKISANANGNANFPSLLLPFLGNEQREILFDPL